MKETTLNLNKNELGILHMAVDELYHMEQMEEHSKGYWEIFDELRYKIAIAREKVQG